VNDHVLTILSSQGINVDKPKKLEEDMQLSVQDKTNQNLY